MAIALITLVPFLLLGIMPIMITSKIPGLITGNLIAILIGYAVFNYLKPLGGKGSGIGLAMVALSVLWGIKTIALQWFPGYYYDIDQFRLWAFRLATAGPAHFYGTGFSYEDINYPPPNYPPVSIYPLWAAGLLGSALRLSWNNLRVLIETPPLLADLLIGIMIFGYLRRAGRPLALAWGGARGLRELARVKPFQTAIVGQQP